MKFNKKNKKQNMKKYAAFMQIILMVSMTFAFAIFMNSSFVSSTGTPAGSTSMIPASVTRAFAGNAFGTYIPQGAVEIVSEIPAGSTVPQLSYVDASGSFIKQAPAGSTVGPITGTTTTSATAAVGGALIAGVLWAGTAYMLAKMVGGFLGLKEGGQKAFEMAAAGGAFTAGTLNSLASQGVGSFGSGSGFLGSIGAHPYLAGFAVAAVIFVLMYKDTTTKVVNFECMPFEPALGGSKCEQCNNDPLRQCSEYRCKSLGQACQLLNSGTAEARCAWVGRDDVKSPEIRVWQEALKPQTQEIKLNYKDDKTRPDGRGTKIESNKGCLPAYTPLEFGILTNEPAQCKIDINHTNKFDQMQYYFGDSNYYMYNHTQKMRLPGPSDGNQSLVIGNDGNFNLYIRCRDANGNENTDEFAITYCVDQGPDTTPPILEEFSIPSGGYVGYNADKVPIEAYVNEPADCKWSTESKNYDDMENTMSCAKSKDQFNVDLQYTCKGNLTGVSNTGENKFYFKCKDQPNKNENERNTMVTSKELILKGSQPLNILEISPNETVTGNTESVNLELRVETDDGAESGKSTCYFSTNQNLGSYIEMFETNSSIHTQTLSLTAGNYNYYVRCVDAGGNVATGSTAFNVFVDKQAPRVTRLYREFEALKIVTDEDAECSYSQKDCNFNFSIGTKMQYAASNVKNNLYADWKPTQTYYIKCQDQYGNEPSPNMCSIIAMPIVLTNKTV